MARHIHVELMKQYAEDAMETDEPWLLWEYLYEGKWHQCVIHPSWSICATFRRKSEMIKIGEYEFPKPISNHTFELGDNYYYVLYGDDGFTVYESVWRNSVVDTRIMNSNLLHLIKQNAQQHADVLNKIHQIK